MDNIKNVPIPDPSTMVLRELTEAQRIQSWRVNSVSWQMNLKTIDDYVARETRNSQSGLAANGGLKYWGFFAGADARAPAVANVHDDQEVYACVEGQRKEMLVKEADGEVKREWIWALASVFTPEKYRGRKIGTWMMKRIGEWIDRQEEGNRFSVLFSDVGEYYSMLGWRTFPSPEMSFSIAKGTDAKSISSTPLTLSTLLPLYQIDIADLTIRLQSIPLPPSTRTLIAALPTAAQASWHFGAAEVAASSIRSAPPHAPEFRGAISSSGKTWIYWFHDFLENKLSILRIVSLFPKDDYKAEVEEQAVQELEAVLRAAQSEAEKWCLSKVVIWAPDDRTLHACRAFCEGQDPKIQTRTDGSVPCVRWKGGNAANDEGWEKNVQWLWCERFVWC